MRKKRLSIYFSSMTTSNREVQVLVETYFDGLFLALYVLTLVSKQRRYYYRVDWKYVNIIIYYIITLELYNTIIRTTQLLYIEMYIQQYVHY